MDLFRVLINERPSELCLIDQNSEEVHNLQSPDEEKNGAHSGFGSNLDQFSSKGKCNFFLQKRFLWPN